jgi:hypothetical protein
LAAFIPHLLFVRYELLYLVSAAISFHRFFSDFQKFLLFLGLFVLFCYVKVGGDTWGFLDFTGHDAVFAVVTH